MIRCLDVRKVYRQGDNEVASLAGVSLDIPAGAFAVIMGPSGSGKSTLLHLIGGGPADRRRLARRRTLDRPNGRRGNHLCFAARISDLFSIFQFIADLTALENVALPFVTRRPLRRGDANAPGAFGKGWIGKTQGSFARSHVRAAKSTHRHRARPGFLIRRYSWLMSPPVILIQRTDEAILDLLKQINSEMRCTVVMVTHSDEAARSATGRFGCVMGGSRTPLSRTVQSSMFKVQSRHNSVRTPIKP